MKVNGRMIKLTDMEFISMLMVPSTMDTGKMISRKVTELRPGLTAANMKVFTERDKRMGKFESKLYCF